MNDEIWKQVLILWESYAIKPDCEVEEHSQNFKNLTLQKLGLIDNDQYIKYGCPFCEKFISNHCEYCPISIYYNKEIACEISTSYNLWIDKFPYHSQKYALAFYHELIKIAKSYGYEPDYNLMDW